MVAIVLDDESYSTIERAGYSDTVSTSKYVRTAPHRSCISSGISLKGKEVHFTHSDAVSSHAPPPKRNPQLEARMVKLRARLADREYAAMIRDVSGGGDGDGEHESISKMLRNAAPASSIGFNLIATMGTCFTAAYFLTNAMTGNRSIALGMGAVGIAGALGIEATLVLTRLYRIEKAEEELAAKKRRQIDKRALHHVNNADDTAVVPKIIIPEHITPRPVSFKKRPDGNEDKIEEVENDRIVPQEEKKTQ